MVWTTKNKEGKKENIFKKRLLIASINSPVLAVKFSDPLSLPFFDVKCVFCLHFLQDGNREISDVVISLGEVLASGLADVTILNVSYMFLDPGPKFTLCLTYILHAATSLEAGHNINHPGGLAINWSINMHNNSCN